MAEVDASSIQTYLATAVATLTALGVGLREYIKREKVGNASDASTIKGLQGTDAILENLIKEVARLNAVVVEMGEKIEDLTDDLAHIRLIALDAYQLANEIEPDSEAKARLLEHLRQIIKGKLPR